MMTNLNKTKEEIIYELVLSLNKGNSCSIQERVRLAIAQYDDLVSKKLSKRKQKSQKRKSAITTGLIAQSQQTTITMRMASYIIEQKNIALNVELQKQRCILCLYKNLSFYVVAE